jgi:hypothetical protein
VFRRWLWTVVPCGSPGRTTPRRLRPHGKTAEGAVLQAGCHRPVSSPLSLVSSLGRRPPHSSCLDPGERRVCAGGRFGHSTVVRPAPKSVAAQSSHFGHNSTATPALPPRRLSPFHSLTTFHSPQAVPHRPELTTRALVVSVTWAHVASRPLESQGLGWVWCTCPEQWLWSVLSLP